MRTYGQFCPVAAALDVLGERWTLLVVREMFSGSRRFAEIQRGVPLMSPTLLSQRLRRLERTGVIQRRPGRGTRKEYELTPAGRELWPVVEGLGVWGQRWARDEVVPEQLDPALLMWDMRRRIDLGRVPDRRLVIQFSFQGISRGRPTWWVKLDRTEVDVCLSDPGFGIDLTVDADLRSMILVWMGDRPLGPTMRSGAISVNGPRALVRAFPSWLRLNLLADAPRPPDQQVATR